MAEISKGDEIKRNVRIGIVKHWLAKALESNDKLSIGMAGHGIVRRSKGTAEQ